ncbi:MAG TPA: DUF2510 domain-containing protein [Propionibacteriaceae bacterium]
MSAPPGWYADPGGQQGLYRFWDGESWSAALSPHPSAPPPQAVPPAPQAQPGTVLPYQPLRPAAAPALTPRKKSYGWALGLLAVLVALVVVVAAVALRVAREPASSTGPGGAPTTAVCPEQDNQTPQPQPPDGRVHGGRLSYPLLGSPWSAPEPEFRVPFARGVLRQSVEIENVAGQQWLAAVLIGQLSAGDGFFSPKDGAAIVVKCVSGTFYGNSEVTRDDQRNEALSVDGHDAWVIESQLRFDVPSIQAKSELLIVVIVDTGDGSAGLYYASIPENAPQLVAPARAALAALRVDA